MKLLIDRLDKELRSEFDHDTEFIIRTMEVIRVSDPETALVCLIDAANRITGLQRVALLGTDLDIVDNMMR